MQAMKCSWKDAMLRIRRSHSERRARRSRLSQGDREEVSYGGVKCRCFPSGGSLDGHVSGANIVSRTLLLAQASSIAGERPPSSAYSLQPPYAPRLGTRDPAAVGAVQCGMTR